MLNVHLLLLIVAFLAFVLATFNVSSRVNMIALGLALWVLTLLVR